jgi:hypothetical protein
MRAYYDGRWRTASNHGFTVKVSTTVHTLKAFGRLGVWEYDAIPAHNIGMQLLGFGSTVAEALATDRAIAETARPSPN